MRRSESRPPSPRRPPEWRASCALRVPRVFVCAFLWSCHVVRQDGRQSKCRSQARNDEASHAGHRLAFERDHLNRMESPCRALPAAVEGKRRLPVRCRRRQPEGRMTTKPAGPREARPDRIASAIPLRPGWHAECDVFGEQRRESLDVHALPGTDIAFEQPLLLVGHCRYWRRMRRQPARRASRGHAGGHS